MYLGTSKNCFFTFFTHMHVYKPAHLLLIRFVKMTYFLVQYLVTQFSLFVYHLFFFLHWPQFAGSWRHVLFIVTSCIISCKTHVLHVLKMTVSEIYKYNVFTVAFLFIISTKLLTLFGQVDIHCWKPCDEQVYKIYSGFSTMVDKSFLLNFL